MPPRKEKDPYDVRLGRALRHYRESAKITQTEMGKACGCTQGAIFKYEEGINRITAHLLDDYCKKLGITPNEILGFEVNPINPDLKNYVSTLSAGQQELLLNIAKNIKQLPI